MSYQTRIDNLTTSTCIDEYLCLSAQINNSTKNRQNVVSTLDELPDLQTANIPIGQLFFVQDQGLNLINTENAWVRVDGYSIRCDFAIRSLWSWGQNTSGQIGIGASTSFETATNREYTRSVNWCQLSSSTLNTHAVKTDGTLWAWGNGGGGKLGNGTATNSTSPVQEFCCDTTWCEVSNNLAHATAIKTDGTLWAWGCQRCGRLGDGTASFLGICSPVQEFCSDTTWCQTAAGNSHSTAIKTDGTLWSWGLGTCGRLGNGSLATQCSPVQEFCSDTTWCQVNAGNDHNVAIKTGGTLWAWGNNICGQLGDGSNTARCSPVQEFCSGTTWTQGAAGRSASSAIKTDGTLWSWGWNTGGRLGIGSNTASTSPAQELCSDTTWCKVRTSDYATTAAIKTNGTLWLWGSQRCGVSLTGTATFAGICSPLQEFTGDTTWCYVSLGCFHGSGIKFTG